MSRKIEEYAREGKINPDASIRDKQSIVINASLTRCWEILTNISDWPKWNGDIKITSFERLEPGSKFSWKINGFSIRSTLQQVNEPYKITWTGKALWIRAIHTWIFEKAEKDQTIVTSKESMQGFLLPLFYTHQKLHADLLSWLSRLKKEAEKTN